jgi:hypothetical protein
MSKENKSAEKTVESKEKNKKPTCGIVMPISEIDGCTAHHWEEVLSIITEVAEDVGFETKLVSEADDVGIIHKRIIQNVYNSDIIICDVSAKNPNVMFELGLRLAFDKATVIIKDDQTSYSFDTSPIEHLNYPRDLRFHSILKFKTLLGKKLTATLEKSQEESHSMYLKDFGQITVAKLDSKEVSKEDYILERLREMQLDIKAINNSNHGVVVEKIFRPSSPLNIISRDKMRDYYKIYLEKHKVQIIENVEDFKKFLTDEIRISENRLPSNRSLYAFVETENIM